MYIYRGVCVYIYIYIYIYIYTQTHTHTHTSGYTCQDSLASSKYILKAIYGCTLLGYPGSSDAQESTCNAGDPGSIPGSGRSPGKGYASGYTCQESPVGSNYIIKAIYDCTPLNFKIGKQYKILPQPHLTCFENHSVVSNLLRSTLHFQSKINVSFDCIFQCFQDLAKSLLK